MKQILLLILIILFSSCSYWYLGDLENIEKVELNELRLEPGYEINKLRIDIIRNTYEKEIDDSTKENKNMPYHPLGFDLGNGLFYDLNGNLCLRIDYLLGFSPENNFEIKKITSPDKWKREEIFSYYQDSLQKIYPPRKKEHYQYYRKEYKDSIAVMYRKRFDYALVNRDSMYLYKGKRYNRDVIYKMDENIYAVNWKSKRHKYMLNDNKIKLKYDYLVELSEDYKSIKIKKQGIKKSWTIYTLEKTQNQLYIYNKKNMGIRIEFDENKICMYSGTTLITTYELINN